MSPESSLRSSRFHFSILVPWVVSAVFAAAFCWPVIAHWGALGIANDWDQHQLYHWVPYVSVFAYGEVPLWNPFACGGIPMLANPQSRWFSPFFPVHLWLGHERALLVEILAHVAIAWLGAFKLARTSSLSSFAAAMTGTVFAGSSAWYLHLGAGHTGWLAYAYMPWILASIAKARWFLAGALLAVAIGEGGTYAVPHTLVLLGVMAAYAAITSRSIRPLSHVAFACAVAVALAAPKLLVMDELMGRLPRLIDSSERVSVAMTWSALASREQILDEEPPGHPYRFLEYGAYVGIIPLVLAGIGIARLPRLAGRWVALAAVGWILSLGATAGGEYSPWALLHRLPVFESQHVPSRFLFPAVLAIALLAGVGIEATRRLLGVAFSAVAAVILIVVAVDLYLVGPPNLSHMFGEAVEARPRSPQFVQYRDESTETMYSLAVANMGAVNCYEPLAPPQAPVGANEPAYRGEQFLTGAGDVELMSWSPHRLVYDIDVPRPTVLVVNQNYDSSWQASSGRMVAYEGLIAVEIPASGRYELVYRSSRFSNGVAITLLALVTAAAAGIYRWRRGRAR